MALLFIFLSALIGTGLAFPPLICRLRRAGIVGKDMHKPGQPEIPEMGGLGVVTGFAIGLVTTVVLKTFFHTLEEVDLTQLMAASLTVLLCALIGAFDDLWHIRQGVKAVAPMLAALPLVAIKAGDTDMVIPFIGQLELGFFYSLILVPLGVTGAANAINMLAGFNGLEAGMGIVAMAFLAIIAYALKEATSLVILLAASGALLAALYFNWYPAKVLIGDVGTLSIGAMLASSVIIGRFEIAGVILIIPYVLDLYFKARHGFPKSFGVYNGGKLYCPPNGPVGLGQFVLKLFGGLHERHLVLILMGVEAVFGLVAIGLYVRL